MLGATGDFVAAGNGTHLGSYVESGDVSITGDDPTALQVDGLATLTAANDKDELSVAITGTMNFLTGTITGTITFEGGTGRFIDATGSAILLAQLQPDGTIAVTVIGTIDY